MYILYMQKNDSVVYMKHIQSSSVVGEVLLITPEDRQNS